MAISRLKAREGHRDLDKAPIGKSAVLGAPLVTRGVFSVREETEASEIAKIMILQKIRRVPVVDGANRVVGIVSRKDILEALIKA